MTIYQCRQDELFGNLQEECAEVIKVVSKIFRFGWDQEKVDALHQEIGDVIALVELLTKDGYLDTDEIEKGMKRKIKKMADKRHMTFHK